MTRNYIPGIVEVMVEVVEMHAMSEREPSTHAPVVIVVVTGGCVDTLSVKVVNTDSEVIKLCRAHQYKPDGVWEQAHSRGGCRRRTARGRHEGLF